MVKEEGLFETWFAQTRLETGPEIEPCLRIPSSFAQRWISREYRAGLEQISNELWNRNLRLQLDDSAPAHDEPRKIVIKANLHQCAPASEPKFQPSDDAFLLDTYFAGPENPLLLPAISTLQPAEVQHSPFVLVGAHGSGKSHLANVVASRWPKTAVNFFHADEFTNAFISASKEGVLESFRQQLRGKKLLVLENFEFFAEGSKAKTLLELQHTLKSLQRTGQQIVLTSSLPITSIPDLPPSLQTLLLSGLRIQIRPPRPETKRQLLDHLVARSGAKLSKPILDLLTEIPFGSMGELKGACRQLLAYAAIEGEGLPLATARELLSDHVAPLVPSQQAGDLTHTVQVVAKAFGVSMARLLSASRARHICSARHTAMLLSQEINRATLREIGTFYGGRLHQSVLFAINSAREKAQADPEVARILEKLRRQLRNATAE